MVKNLIIENLIIDITVLKLFQWKWNFKRNYFINKSTFVFLYSQLFHIVEWKWFLRILWQIHQQTTWIEMSTTAFYLHDITVILISIKIKMLIWYRSSILSVIICFIETKRVQIMKNQSRSHQIKITWFNCYYLIFKGCYFHPVKISKVLLLQSENYKRLLRNLLQRSVLDFKKHVQNPTKR